MAVGLVSDARRRSLGQYGGKRTLNDGFVLETTPTVLELSYTGPLDIYHGDQVILEVAKPSLLNTQSNVGNSEEGNSEEGNRNKTDGNSF